MSYTDTEPRVNSARLPDYVGKTVRLVSKIIRIDDKTGVAIVQASDGGEVKVKLLPGSQMDATFAEVLGIVQDADTIKMQKWYNIGDDIDMGLADFSVEKWHDPKFAGTIFSTETL